ncbi:MAG: hypothetical protein ACTSRI_21460, partial [Promethearchaeota archaeon]
MDPLEKKTIAGALVTGESEEETVFLLKELKKWFLDPVNFLTIDFSARLEAGVNEVFPYVILQKCVFYAIQLLTRGLIKEFTKIKKEHFLDHIEEWKLLRRFTHALEKNEQTIDTASIKFDDVELSLQIYSRLRKCLSRADLKQIEQELQSFFSSSQFSKWKAKHAFISKYDDIFSKRNFTFSLKGITYVIPKIYIAFRTAIRELRKELEETKSHFNKVNYLVLMNPNNMKSFQKKELRKALANF